MTGSVVQDDWKDKYRDLLGELADKESSWRQCEKTLRLTATRLGIAAMGRDAQIDAQLEDIVSLVKTPGSEEALREPLESLARSVVEQENTATFEVVPDFAGFVADLPLPADQQRRVLDAMERGGPAGTARALGHLAHCLRDLLALPTDDGPTIANAVQGLLRGFGEISESLPQLEPIFVELQNALSEQTAAAAWDPLLRQFARAIGQAVLDLQEERSELEAFLEQVTDRLTEFDAIAESSRNEALERAADTEDLEQGVGQQVGELQEDVQASQDIGDLKSRVKQRLDTIAERMSVFRQREDERANTAETRQQVLQEQVNRLRVRTNELAVRCGEQEQRLMYDSLTGVHSRHAYDQRLQEEFQRWQRHAQPLTYALWDIDHFKHVNDTYGHQTGDDLLRDVARMLSKNTRTEDFVARIGGEEFVVLFIATSADPATQLANRLREHIGAKEFEHNGQVLNVSISCGLTEFRPSDTPKSVYDRADQALYAAKNAGRNRCVMR
ncbi:MAG: diguanylate cyclase [Gammaproteobacteria bacterium]